MNVMTIAHKMTKAIIKHGSNDITGSYREIFKVCLKQAHKEYKAMQKPTTKTEAGQKAIRELGAQTFRNQSSVNPYKEGTLAHDLFKDGWIEASQAHYKNQGV
ncbi:hypothetical protein vBPpSSYP_4 [Pseudomonas phage vB_PpS_SYP]|nr:hypothetical protein vBPpSSYP_4 [Pseudomonas phage vB_PpS_SYP]